MNQKGFIVPLLAIILVIAAGIGGYEFLKYQKERGASSSLLMLKSKCREDGKSVADERIKMYSRDLLIFTRDPQYTYNESLKTCLYAHSYMGGPLPGAGGVKYNAFIMDVYTNRPIIDYSEIAGEQLGSISRDDFNKKYKELFQTAENFFPSY